MGNETIGQRLQRFRKLRGYTQKELAAKIGIIQSLVSSYEGDKLKLSPEMIIRFAIALNVSTDEILGYKKSNSTDSAPSLKILRRLKEIEKLPVTEQKTLLKTIDNFLRGAKKGE
jgi:transcriptional regulator with XRE-family HTH domain